MAFHHSTPAIQKKPLPPWYSLTTPEVCWVEVPQGIHFWCDGAQDINHGRLCVVTHDNKEGMAIFLEHVNSCANILDIYHSGSTAGRGRFASLSCLRFHTARGLVPFEKLPTRLPSRNRPPRPVYIPRGHLPLPPGQIREPLLDDPRERVYETVSYIVPHSTLPYLRHFPPDHEHLIPYPTAHYLKSLANNEIALPKPTGPNQAIRTVGPPGSGYPETPARIRAPSFRPDAPQSIANSTPLLDW